MKMKLVGSAVAMAVLMAGCTQAPETSPLTYDLVINQGRVIDPETNTDKIMNIGIKNGVIETLTNDSLSGERIIDADGMIVGPGFIDLHTHSGLPFGALLQIRDGATTALELEAGAYPASDYGNFLRSAPYLNFGASVSHALIRVGVIEGETKGWFMDEDGTLVPEEGYERIATTEEVELMRNIIVEELKAGGLGIGFLLDYMSPAVSDEELRMIFEVAAEHDAVIWAHIRRGVNGDIQPLLDVLDVAVETGAPLHICHINANAMGAIGDWMEVIDNANADGADITMEIFPYTAGSTFISADVFDRDWKTIFDISYEDVQWAETGEYFTEDTWYKMRKERPDGMIIHHYMQEDWLREAMVHPDMIIATDAMPALNANLKSAPNGAGSYTRVLAQYVRDEGVISLNDAFYKSSYLPAKRLEGVAPVFTKKGRVQEGAHADLLIFDIDNINSAASYTDPFVEATGYSYVMIEGEIVLENDELTLNAPGRNLLGTTPAE
ncbi:amidohydrolase family protein [Vibrio sp. WXL103]|uniref:amidohydrolase family protein n=1 Tax=Vibrio sp. WXL103 TaxID=3450710 RepID=UPI003EC5B92A